jgi:outer membrane protein assembly factor BamB
MTRPSGGRRRRLVWAAAGLASLVLAAAAVVLLTGRQGDVSNPNVAFDTAPPTAPTPKPKPSRDPFADGFEWPIYGYSKSRTHYLPLSRNLRPPFTVRWRVGGSVLLEFPPTLCGKSLFLLKNDGALLSISRRTGAVRWRTKLGTLAAASPACSQGTVYAVLLTRGNGIQGGSVVAVDAGTGRTRWSRKLPSRSESSPLVDRDRLYFGSEDGTVYALRTSDGAIRWTYKTGGAVKGGLALDRGRLYFGDYGGQVTAIRQADGSKIWSTGTSGGAFGLRSGQFYATPALAFGRVYIGNTDGFVYSFGANDGSLAWRHRTGGYVYSSPAVSPVLGGTVYAGSYDGNLYAFDARSGNVRWARNTGGKISGAPVVIGDMVFYSNLGRKSIGAVGAATGKLMWSFNSGAFNPVISDGTRLYLNGYSTLYMLAEKGRNTDGTLTTAGRVHARNQMRAVAQRRRARYVARMAAQRRADVRRILDMRRRNIPVCFVSSGKRVCRVPQAPVCFPGQGGRTVCRARRS